jgi:uracil-DNA glycosylase
MQDLPVSFKKHWTSCNLCEIGKCKTKTFYRGSVPCTYLFIGEAPGPSEAVVGEPFIGRAGKHVLQPMLDASGIQNYGITNVIACFPFEPDNRAKFRKPEKEEIENCKDRLNELTECVTPKYYIALGKVAKANPPTGVEYHLALDHPSYILRNGGKTSVMYKKNLLSLVKFLRENG